MIERVAYKPFINSTRVAALTTADWGVHTTVENAMSYFFGPESRPFPSTGTETITLFGTFLSNGKQILISGVTGILMALLRYRTLALKMGKPCVRLRGNQRSIMGLT